MSEKEPERGILMSLPHQRKKHFKLTNFIATIYDRVNDIMVLLYIILSLQAEHQKLSSLERW